MARLLVCGVVAVGVFAATAASAVADNSAPATQVWFAPRQDNVDVTLPPGQRVLFTKYDFASMLSAGAPWRKAFSHVSLLTIAGHSIQHYPDLSAIIAMTNQYSGQIATSGNMVYTDGACALQGLEGMDGGSGFGREVVANVRNWKARGGRLDYIIMDGPYYYGYYEPKNDCHYSIAEVARRAAATFKEIQKLYPNIKIMDAEGPGPVRVNVWLQGLRVWLGAFKAAAGHPIDAVGMDLHWSDAWHTGYDWVSAARTTTVFLHGLGIAAGLYIDADASATSDQDWMNASRQHLQTAAQSVTGLDFLYIASWANYPTRNLPESDPTALTSLINSAVTDLQSTQ